MFAKCVRVSSWVDVLLYYANIMSNQNCTSFVLEPITCPVIFLTRKILIGDQTGVRPIIHPHNAINLLGFNLFICPFCPTIHFTSQSILRIKIVKIFIKAVQQFSWRAKQFISIHLLALKLCVFKAGTDICMRGWVSGWMPRQPEPSPCQPTSSTSASRWLLSSLIDQDFRIVQPAVDFLI